MMEGWKALMSSKDDESPLSTYQSEVTGYLHMLPFDGKNLRRTRRDPREREDPGAPISLLILSRAGRNNDIRLVPDRCILV